MSAPIIHVVGIGLAGTSSLTSELIQIIQSATLVVGGKRHLSAVETVIKTDLVDMLPLGDFTQVFEDVRSHIATHPHPQPVILASGDPLFFGIGRLLLSAFPPEQLVFHPHLSSIQLAFSRIKQPWQNATLLSLHGRSEDLFVKALKQGDETIALLTDGVMTPSAIATLIISLDISTRYHLWICEDLGGKQERTSKHWPEQLAKQPEDFSLLSVVILQRQTEALPLSSLPLIGLPDSAFKGFRDRPTLMTKREIRLLILGEMAPLDGQILWDIGAGTGSVSIELSRLCPNATLYAIEKTAAGVALIKENADRLAIAPVHAIYGEAPNALQTLPAPDCVFIGGSSGQLLSILDDLSNQLSNQGSLERIVLAIATLDNLTEVLTWVKAHPNSDYWNCRLTQVNIARSLPISSLTRFSPLTPITLVTLSAK